MIPKKPTVVIFVVTDNKNWSSFGKFSLYLSLLLGRCISINEKI